MVQLLKLQSVVLSLILRSPASWVLNCWAFGQAGAGAHLDKSHGTAKFDDADADVAVHAVDQRIFKED